MILGLRQKLAAFLLPIIVLPLMGMGYLFYIQERDALQVRALDNMQDVMESISSGFETSMASRYASIQLLSESSLIRRYMVIEDETARYYSFYRPILELFASYQQTFPEFSELKIVNEEGLEEVRLGRLGVKNSSVDESEQVWFKEARLTANKMLSKVLVNPDSGRTSIYIVKPLPRSIYTDWKRSGPSDIGGYLVVTLEPERLFDLVEAKRIGKAGRLFLLNSDGDRVVPAPKLAELDIALTEELYEKRQGLKENIRLINIEEARYFASHRPLLNELLLFGYWPEEEKLTVVENVAGRVLWPTILSLIAVTLLIFSAVNRLVIRPIFKLRELAIEIGKGNFDYLGASANKFIESGGRQDEIGELTRSINEMSINLEASRMKMHFTANHDSLTGLNNRRSFVRYLKRAIGRAIEREGEIVVLFVDTDGFKEVNDTLGHLQGDNVLRVMAKRFTRVTRLSLIASQLGISQDRLKLSLNRIGGDEFAVVIEGYDPVLEAQTVARLLIDEMKEPFIVDHQPYHLGISVGISLFPKDGEDVITLLKRADIAMYKAKAEGGNRYRFYDPVLEQSAVERHQIEIELRTALKENQFCLFYQPQFEALNGMLIGCEALIRWRHPEKGLVPPGLFISHAESNGLIVPMGEWALEEACRQNKSWQIAGLKPIKVAVNFSTVQFHRTEDITSMITGKLEKTGLDASCLDVEITETGMMQSGDIGLDILNEIKAAGVNISMDDFGTGYSSLASLRDMPIDRLKIDKSFVDGIDAGDSGQAIIKAIIALAKQLDLQVVAEGVEESSQMEFLKFNGCDYIQGYLLGRPVPAAEMEVLLKKHTTEQEQTE